MFKKVSLNNKGFQVSTVAFVILVSVLLFSGIVYVQLYKLVAIPIDNKNILEKYNTNRNIDEIVSGLLKANPSYYGVEYYPKYNSSVYIGEISSEFNSINLGGTNNNYEIAVKNATDININFEMLSEVGIYSIDILKDGVSILSAEQKLPNSSDVNIFIPSSYLYDISNGDTRYGIYTVSINKAEDVIVEVSISFNELKNRVVQVEDGERIRKIIVPISN